LGRWRWDLGRHRLLRTEIPCLVQGKAQRASRNQIHLSLRIQRSETTQGKSHPSMRGSTGRAAVAGLTYRCGREDGAEIAEGMDASPHLLRGKRCPRRLGSVSSSSPWLSICGVRSFSVPLAGGRVVTWICRSCLPQVATMRAGKRGIHLLLAWLASL
jgi:hypothetical protein